MYNQLSKVYKLFEDSLYCWKTFLLDYNKFWYNIHLLFLFSFYEKYFTEIKLSSK